MAILVSLATLKAQSLKGGGPKVFILAFEKATFSLGIPNQLVSNLSLPFSS